MNVEGQGGEYIPSPLETSDIRLEPSLQELLERVAENIHENWAQARLQEGWCYGPHRDDERRETPCLVPYRNLPEVEKDYDRKTVEQSLKTILKFGFAIVPPAANPCEPIESPLPLNDPFEYAEALALWNVRDRDLWSRRPCWYRDLGNRLLKKGEALFAYDIFTEACQLVQDPAWKDRLRLRRAFAMAESGAGSEAIALLADPVCDPACVQERWETLGRLHKDLAHAAGSVQGRGHWRNAAEAYAHGHGQAVSVGNSGSAYYCAINVATARMFLGDREGMRDWTRIVFDLCAASGGEASEDFWLLATLAEASLLDLDRGAAGRLYARAVLLARDDARAVRSMARQALWIAREIGLALEDVSGWFRLRPDACLVERGQPDGAAPVPPLGALYAAVANEEDVRRLERLQESGVSEMHLVLPHPAALLTEELPPGDSRRFQLLAARAASLEHVLETPASDPGGAQAFARLVALGKARLRTRGFLPLLLVTEREGGFVLVDGERGAKDIRPSEIGRGLQENGSSCLPFLFADVKGFSGLGNLQIERFVQVFWPLVEDVRSPHADHVLQAQTAGDGLFLVFDDLGSAAAFAMELAQRFRDEDWSAHGLPADLSIRISLDCGPCASYPNPVSRDLCFCGAILNRAARIEPVTPPGKVYVSDSFVYACLALGLPGFEFSYVGRTALPKGAGMLPLFHMRLSARGMDLFKVVRTSSIG